MKRKVELFGLNQSNESFTEMNPAERLLNHTLFQTRMLKIKHSQVEMQKA